MRKTENQINSLSYSEMLVLLNLLAKAGDTGKAVTNITQKAIADSAGITSARVCQALSSLEDKGLITIFDEVQPRTYEIDAEIAARRDIVVEALQMSIEGARKQSHNGDIEIIRANIQDITSRVKAGESYKSVAEDMNVNSCLVSKECSALGIRSKYASPYENSKRSKMEANKESIIEAYENCSTLKKIGETHSVHHETIRYYLNEWGVNTSPAARKERITAAK